ncbi:MAG: DMT family transporter [Hyphomicrobiaceae bacterium]|nr:DMT family transporter [Hyphomicrobiaceae bacterium]
MLLRLAPMLFVLLWSTGFIGSKVIGEHAEPFTALSIRFGLVLLVLAPIAYFVPSPSRLAARDAGIAGALIHALYIGGVMWALRDGMPTGIVAMVVCLQPVLTALLAGPLLGETVSLRHWGGLTLGLAGVALVVGPKMAATVPHGTTDMSPWAVPAAALGLSAITLGTLWQKARGQSGDLRALAFWQYVGALALSLAMALTFETMHVAWTTEFVLGMAWLVLVLSIGAIGLLLMLIRASAVSRVTSLFYLVPAVTALMAWAMFGERLGAVQLFGIALVMIAVLLIGSLRRT